jgi:hypothetical protein
MKSKSEEINPRSNEDLVLLGFPDYDSMNRAQLIDECRERGIEIHGEPKGAELRSLLRNDDNTFGSLRPGLPVPEALATGLAPMSAESAAAQAVRSVWGTTQGNTDNARRPLKARPATAADRSTQMLRKHIEASVSRAETVTALQHPPWIEAARAERQRQNAMEKNKETVLSQGWTRSVKTDEQDMEVPSDAELSKLPVPINQTKLRIMMGQPMDVIQRNSHIPMGNTQSRRREEVKEDDNRLTTSAISTDGSAITHSNDMDLTGVMGETRRGDDDQRRRLSTGYHPIEGGSTSSATGLSVIASSFSSSSRNNNTDSSMNFRRPQSAAAILSLPNYSIETAAKNATVGLQIQRADQAEAAAKAAGMSSFSAALGVSKTDLMSFSTIAATQRRAALKAKLEQHQLDHHHHNNNNNNSNSSILSSSSSQQGSRTLSSSKHGNGSSSSSSNRPTSARPSSATDSRIGRPGVELIRTLGGSDDHSNRKTGGGGEESKSGHSKRMPKHVRYLNELKWQVREVSQQVRQTRQEILNQIDSLLVIPEHHHHGLALV